MVSDMTKRIKSDAGCRCLPALDALIGKMADAVREEADESIDFIIILANYCTHEGGVQTVLRAFSA
jgi:hypothetical protein